MNKKGFTLIELLAVIVILAIIALIATPIINNVITESKMRALEQSLNGIVEAIRNKGITDMIHKTDSAGVYEIKDGKTDLDIGYKGDIPDSGRISIDENGEINIVVYNDDLIGIYNDDSAHVEKNDHIDFIANNVEDLKTKNAIAGSNILTYGYYDIKIGGASTYKILASTDETVDNANIIKLNNGLFAKLIVKDDTLNVSQYGAYGDGIHDDTNVLNLAFASAIKNINLENKTYKVTNILDANKSDKIIKGKESIIFTENDYSNTREWLFKIDGANNVIVDGIKFETRNTNKTGYKTQFCIRNATNIKVINSSFSIPNTVDISDGKEYTNMDLYTNWHDITINNCKFYNVTKADAGGGIWIRDMGGTGSDNVIFSNNYLEKSSHDEILGVFRGKIDKVNINHNTFYSHEDGVANPSVMVVTLGSESSTQATNINFSYNKVVGEGTMTLIRSNHAAKVEIDHNELEYKALSSDVAYGLFNETSESFNLHDNKMIFDIGTSALSSVFKGNMDVKNNNIHITSKMNYFSTEKESTFVGNDIKIDLIDGEIIRNTKLFKDNIVTVVNRTSLKSLVRFYSITMNTDSLIEGNTFHLSDDIISGTSSYLLIQKTTMGGHTITLRNNKVDGVTTNATTKNLVYYNTVLDTTPQTVYISGNNTLPFKGTNGRYDCLAEHKVIAQ